MVNNELRRDGVRVLIGLAGATLVCFLTWLVQLMTNLGLPCGGDGGSPYAAPGSPAASFCQSPAPTALTLFPLAVFCVTLGVLVWRGFRRRREWWLILAPLCSFPIVWAVLDYFAAHAR